MTQTFDRTPDGKRIHFASAMTLLGYHDSSESPGNPPMSSPSLQDYPHADQLVKTTAHQIWGDGTEKHRTYGNGQVFCHNDLKDVLKSLDLATDFSADAASIEYTHRTLDGKEIYFIANTSGKNIAFTAMFRASGLQPELWDPLTGISRLLPAFESNGTGTKVPLKLAANGSAFIVFGKKGKPSAKTLTANFPEPKVISTFEGAWQVSFEHDLIKRRPKEPVSMPALIDWSKSADERIREYSGSAIYSKGFLLPSYNTKDNDYYLDLGNLSATAKVKVNGKYVGGTWTFPYQVNISDAIKSGENTVEIEVINTWKNRLIGDHKLPAKQRIVQSKINPWNGDNTLQPSGLWGPVTLLESKR